MDFMKALTFPFEDEDWLKKVGLAVLIQFIPVVGMFALQGWSFQIAKRVKNNDPVPLPDWSDFGGLLGKGFMIWLGSMIYQIPTLIFGCAIWFVFALPALGGGNEDTMAALGSASVIIASCCGCLILLYAIAAALVSWGGLIRYLDTEQFSTFLQFGDNFALVRNNIGDFGMALAYLIGAGLIGGVISGTGIGGFLVGPFLNYFSGHVIGQLASKISGTAAPAV